MNNINYVCPYTGENLILEGDKYISPSNKIFKIRKGIPRFCTEENYSETFGFQWNLFDKVQLDSFSKEDLSHNRFWAETDWDPKELEALNVLEVGSGAGRFTEVFLKSTEANLYSIDYSSAVEANLKNNYKYCSRLFLSQASIYEMPFEDCAFERIFCLGVLQHTPNFENSVKSLIRKLKINGEVVVDFYPSKGIITKIHSKYILRPILKRLPKRLLLFLISKTVPISLFIFDLLCSLKLDIFVRFLPITDVRGFPENLNFSERKKWAIMDTFDAFSPEFDNPQKLNDVIDMFIKEGCKIKYAGLVSYDGGSSTVIRAIRQ